MSAINTKDVTIPGPVGSHVYQLPHWPRRYTVIEYPEQAVLLGEPIFNSTVKHVAYDVETAQPDNNTWTGLHRMARVFGASFSIGDEQIPERTFWYRFGGANEDLDEYMTNVIRHIFSGEGSYNVIMHHAAFDINRTRHTLDVEWLNPTVNDTLLMAQIMNKFVSNSLKNLGNALLKEAPVWDMRLNDWFRRNKIKTADRCFSDVPEPIIAPYAMADTDTTYRIFFKLKEHLSHESQALVELYKLERQLIPVVADIEWRGMRMDMPYFEQQMQSIRAALEHFTNNFEQLWGKINLNSPKQLVEVLYGTDYSKGHLGLPVTVRSIKTKQPSTKSDVIETYIDDFPIVEDFVKFQRLSRALTTMQKLVLQSCDTSVGRTIHTSYTQILNSGRFSSSPNLQNFINDDRGKYKAILRNGGDVSIRKGFIPPDGYLYVKIDYAAFELRLIANASGDLQLQRMILDGVDMHSWLATRLYANELQHFNEKCDGGYEEQFAQGDNPLSRKWKLDWRYWAVTAKANDDLKRMRNVVKICSFSIVYGAGSTKISKTFGVTEREAERLKEVWFTNFKRVAEWRRMVNIETDRTKKVYSMFGRIRRLQPREYVGTISVNHVIQGTAADLLKFAMRDISTLLKCKLSYICSTIHDEIQLYVHKSELDLIPELMKCVERERLPRDIMPVPMIAEVSVSSHNWHDCVELHGDIVQRLQGMCDE